MRVSEHSTPTSFDLGKEIDVVFCTSGSTCFAHWFRLWYFALRLVLAIVPEDRARRLRNRKARGALASCYLCSFCNLPTCMTLLQSSMWNASAGVWASRPSFAPSLNATFVSNASFNFASLRHFDSQRAHSSPHQGSASVTAHSGAAIRRVKTSSPVHPSSSATPTLPWNAQGRYSGSGTGTSTPTLASPRSTVALAPTPTPTSAGDASASGGGSLNRRWEGARFSCEYRILAM